MTIVEAECATLFRSRLAAEKKTGGRCPPPGLSLSGYCKSARTICSTKLTIFRIWFFTSTPPLFSRVDRFRALEPYLPSGRIRG
jgi:hypothetical protein